MNYQIFMALKHLTKRRRKGFVSLISLISILGVALGVMALIVVMAVMSGFDRELKLKIVGMNPHIVVEKIGGITESKKVIDDIQKLDPRFNSIAEYVQGQTLIRSASNAIGAIVRGVDPVSDQLNFVKKNLIVGDLAFQERRDEKGPVGALAIGSSLAHILKVGIGDPVFLISPHFSEEKGIDTKKRAKVDKFYVSGIFELGMNEFDTTMVLTDLVRARTLYSMEGRSSGLSIRLQNVDEAGTLKTLLEATLGGGYWIRSWQDMNRNFFDALKVEKSVMRILLTLIVTVAGFNIISTLIMVVMEKTKEIGVLRALGATRGGIKSIFLLEGFTIGAFGTLLGGLGGYFTAKHINTVAAVVEKFTGFEVFPKDIYYFNEIPAQIIPSDIFYIILFALLMALFAGLYPAHEAGKVSPVEAIRYE